MAETTSLKGVIYLKDGTLVRCTSFRIGKYLTPEFDGIACDPILLQNLKAVWGHSIPTRFTTNQEIHDFLCHTFVE
jgi:hypothetical protein